MAHIVILGAGIGGMPCAIEMRDMLPKQHQITVVNALDYFQFVPSNPWVALGWRAAHETTFKLRPYLEKKGIRFIAQRADEIDAANSRIHLAKVAFEKYFMRKMKTGNSEPLYEKYVLKALGIKRLN